jgi:hypothetical protein
MITDDENEELFYDQTGQAYVLAIGATTPTRITGEVDYNGDPWLCQRLATYIQHNRSDPPTRQINTVQVCGTVAGAVVRWRRQRRARMSIASISPAVGSARQKGGGQVAGRHGGHAGHDREEAGGERGDDDRGERAQQAQRCAQPPPRRLWQPPTARPPPSR